jgi:hypothetical protein
MRSFLASEGEDPMMIKDSNDVVRINDASESAGLLEFKLID